LYKSDHGELKLYDCDDELAMHFKLDFIEDGMPTDCGYASAGVTGGDGKMFVGDPDHVLATTSSLDRNMNGCGYCDEESSPCPGGEGYEVSPDAPEWDFRMVYELWVSAEAFGSAGFCRPGIEYVHATPAKGKSDTVLVEPDECPPPDGPPPDEDCPPNYELFLASEGEYLCAGPPTNGEWPGGYELDLESEGGRRMGPRRTRSAPRTTSSSSRARASTSAPGLRRTASVRTATSWIWRAKGRAASSSADPGGAIRGVRKGRRGSSAGRFRASWSSDAGDASVRDS